MKPIYLVDGARTPFLKAKGAPGPFSASDLAVQAGRAVLLRQPLEATDLDEVVVGCAIPSADEANIGRVVSLRLGCGHRVQAHTVMRNCASGLQAIDAAWMSLASGRSQLVLAGGVDALSRAPLTYDDPMVRWFAQATRMRTPMQKLQHFTRLPVAAALKPVISLLRGLTDPVVGLSMGQTAENLAHRFKISRTEMDSFSQRSHARAVAARAAGAFGEITPVVSSKGEAFEQDDGVREDASLSGLAKLKPVFDKPAGNITAGNSSQVTDGAAMVLLASEEAVARWNLKPIARLTDLQWAGLDPAEMGLGPVHAATPLLQRNQIRLEDLDLIEINEAFAAQVIACQRAWESEDYCREQLGLPSALGSVDENKLNVDGGAVSIGHPVGASGARITLHLAQALRARGLKRGLAAICIGGGQGGAILVEAL